MYLHPGTEILPTLLLAINFGPDPSQTPRTSDSGTPYDHKCSTISFLGWENLSHCPCTASLFQYNKAVLEDNQGSTTMGDLNFDSKDMVSTQASHLEHEEYPDQAELDRLDRRIVRKMDLTVLPLVSVIYLLAYIDRANIGNARVVSHESRLWSSIIMTLIRLDWTQILVSMTTITSLVCGPSQVCERSLSHNRLAVTITYIPYILVEIPSNLALKKVGPAVMLPLMSTCWGIVTTLQSQVHSFGGLAAARIFLGACEGGLFPGMTSPFPVSQIMP